MSGIEEEPDYEGWLTHQRLLWPFKVSLLECSIRESDLADGAPASQQECWLVIGFKSSCFHFFILELNFGGRGRVTSSCTGHLPVVSATT